MFFVSLVVALSTAGYAMMGKTGSGMSGISDGQHTSFGKGHSATVDYTPHLIVNYDKQYKSWAQSTLNPENIRKEKPMEFFVIGWFSG